MIITLISFGILLAGVVMFTLGRVGYKQRYTSKRPSFGPTSKEENSPSRRRSRKFWFRVYDCFYKTDKVFITIIVGIVTSVICISLVIINLLSREANFIEKVYEKKVIEYRLEHKSENIVGNELLYNDVVEFNNDLRSVKYWSNNPWTSWFVYNEGLVNLGYVEFDESEG